MKKYKEKYIEWLERKNNKNIKKTTSNKKKKSKKKFYDYIKDSHGKIHRVKINEKELKAPENFSIINNTEETVLYFRKIIQYIKAHNGSRFNALFFNVAHIKNMSIDAIMYLLAIIYNFNNLKTSILRIKGNGPRDKDIKRKMVNSGFFNMIKDKDSNITSNNNMQEILYGELVDGTAASRVIRLAENYFGLKKCFKFLYNIIIELMTNTKSHAYGNRHFTINSWYLYAECGDDKLYITFIDTGLGIPDTILKKVLENLKDKYMKRNRDAQYILSALKGDFRTRTREKNRNKGMPEIFNYYKDNKIENLKIVSCYGKIDTNRQCHDINEYAIGINNYLYGTVFYLEIHKNNFQIYEGVKNENKYSK